MSGSASGSGTGRGRVTKALAALRGRPGTLAAAAVLVLALWEVTVLARAQTTAPTDADWRAAAAAVTAEFAQGDLIVFAPRWVDPVGRRWLGDHLTVDDAARMDAARFGRIWEVSIRGAHAPETRGIGKPIYERTFGRVRVRRFERPAARVHWSFHQRTDVSEVAHEPHRCARLSPARAGAEQPTRRSVPNVTLGRELVVYAGLADVWARRDNRAYADLRVLVDDVEVAAATIGNDSGWLRLPVAATTPGPHAVTFEARTNPTRGDPKKARLDLCVAAEARDPGEGGE